MLAATLLLALPFTPQVLAWGDGGHQIVGYIAQAFLSSDASSFVSEYLDASYDGQLAYAATWADTVKYESRDTGIVPYHFVDAKDLPLSGSCAGAGGCLLTAIANYTARITEPSLSKAERGEALKFLTHFFGDITPPLQGCENYAIGGNDIDVTFNGESENLHSVWDTGIIELNLKNNYAGNVKTYADSLVQRLQSGDLQPQASAWISCVDLTGLTEESFECPTTWASDSNASDCSFVSAYTEGSDLAETSYYTDAIPVVDVQLAKGGYRLAAWLDTLFHGDGGGSGTNCCMGIAQATPAPEI